MKKGRGVKAEGWYLDIGHCKRSSRVSLNIIAVAVNPETLKWSLKFLLVHAIGVDNNYHLMILYAHVN